MFVLYNIFYNWIWARADYENFGTFFFYFPECLCLGCSSVSCRVRWKLLSPEYPSCSSWLVVGYWKVLKRRMKAQLTFAWSPRICQYCFIKALKNIDKFIQGMTQSYTFNRTRARGLLGKDKSERLSQKIRIISDQASVVSQWVLLEGVMILKKDNTVAWPQLVLMLNRVYFFLVSFYTILSTYKK